MATKHAQGAQDSPATMPPQHQARQPGREGEMHPRPQSFAEHYVGAGRLRGKVALVTGGDSGIGRAAAIAFAKEGADVAIAFLEECEDARQTRAAIEACGRRALSVAVDLGDEAACAALIERVVRELGALDVLVNNAAEQHPQESIADLSAAQLERTFRTNVFAMFHCVKAALPHLKAGARIINTSSVTAYQGSAHLLDAVGRLEAAQALANVVEKVRFAVLAVVHHVDAGLDLLRDHLEHGRADARRPRRLVDRLTALLRPVHFQEVGRPR